MTRPLADDIRASLREARDHASGNRTKAIVRRETPGDSAARTLIEVIKNEPKAVRRAIAKSNSAA